MYTRGVSKENLPVRRGSKWPNARRETVMGCFRGFVLGFVVKVSERGSVLCSGNFGEVQERR